MLQTRHIHVAILAGIAWLSVTQKKRVPRHGIGKKKQARKTLATGNIECYLRSGHKMQSVRSRTRIRFNVQMNILENRFACVLVGARYRTADRELPAVH